MENTLAASLAFLTPNLSAKASVNFCTEPEYAKNTERWSHFNEPQAGAVVNVTCERDIEITVKWATVNKIPFIARSGGHGWTSSLATLASKGVIINLRALNQVSVDLENGTCTIAAGCQTGEVLNAAHAAGAHVVVGTCNPVGAIPPMLGGGLGNLITLHGLAIDNFLSARLITATGSTLTVSATENPDLWYALRGAGHNFGIVSSLTVKAHPQVNGGMHWSSMLVFSPDKLEQIAKLLNDGLVGHGMSCLTIWARPPPSFQPVIIAFPWCAGPEDEAREKFGKLLSLGPLVDQGGMVPYNMINAPSEEPSKKGGRKPTYAIGVESLDEVTLREAFEEWKSFTEGEGLGGSVVLVEAYDWTKVTDVPEGETAFPWRRGGYEILAVCVYGDEKLDGAAKEYGERFRGILRGREKGEVYVNFACGDESLEQMYGSKERVEKLKALKEKWDPEGVFSFYNPIS